MGINKHWFVLCWKYVRTNRQVILISLKTIHVKTKLRHKVTQISLRERQCRIFDLVVGYLHCYQTFEHWRGLFDSLIKHWNLLTGWSDWRKSSNNETVVRGKKTQLTLSDTFLCSYSLGYNKVMLWLIFKDITTQSYSALLYYAGSGGWNENSFLQNQRTRTKYFSWNFSCSTLYNIFKVRCCQQSYYPVKLLFVAKLYIFHAE